MSTPDIHLYGRARDFCQAAGRSLLNGLLAVAMAPRCVACDEPLDDPLAGPVCAACWRYVRLITPPVCDRCGDPLPVWRTIAVEASQCPRCRRSARWVDKGRAVGEYEGVLRAIVHAVKYKKRRSLVPRLAVLMRQHGADMLAGADWVVPVPLHPRRRRARGFNQADDLACALGLPVTRCLVRTRNTPPQAALPAGQRHRNVRDAFVARPHRSWRKAWRRRPALAGTCVVVVDDVTTTGATLEACARALKEAGVREVRALTAARAVLRRP